MILIFLNLAEAFLDTIECFRAPTGPHFSRLQESLRRFHPASSAPHTSPQWSWAHPDSPFWRRVLVTEHFWQFESKSVHLASSKPTFAFVKTRRHVPLQRLANCQVLGACGKWHAIVAQGAALPHIWHREHHLAGESNHGETSWNCSDFFTLTYSYHQMISRIDTYWCKSMHIDACWCIYWTNESAQLASFEHPRNLGSIKEDDDSG